ncbi:hypothetical protein LMG26685_05233 [Achromobacter mucicolens]|jgi:hypothetical protein|uniref:hypothetical protein n=1 Tax=Achromobacter mucicolens TaxID=1389922 RepID=UPI0009C9886E|nr:hypothetical protein [Achromobacter mucicolens]MDG9968215.1 hypothetical protein [Achromobacter mucicolens]OXC90156.1 hypothetical protein BMR85_013690 [Achromobacter sp. KAs 3-5]CAB3699689.1 hypothetical protein LMG26685_05233 [Achromobacter mucicolens]
MWSFIKRWFAGPPAAEDPLQEIVRFDDAGLTRSGELARAMGLQEFWPWRDIHEFGFVFTQAIYPDPWFGDYMESLWFVRVPTDGGGLMRMDFDERVLDINQLPPALLRNLPGLDMDVLRAGLATAARGLRHFEGEGEWVAWRRADAASPDLPSATRDPDPA